ncbi:acyl-CoA transferase [Bartonella rattaustraliani]|uniref:acyl-CoA transferase n=1 Tax=Bartonella rattaustraliani TaxID=481139 RepID=UPI0002EC50C5|nr:acyl-CoA transferase [Bartonella rattaustraliani]
MPNIRVLRNEVLSTAISEGGLVVLRDGEPGDPDILLSPPRYIYKHRAEIEVFVQKASIAQRDSEFDQLLMQIGAALNNAGTLDGVIDILSLGSPEVLTELIEGGATIKAATLPVTLEYVTENPFV